MTRRVVSVAPDTELADIADLLEKRAIKRVPVLQNGRLVGIVSRHDMIAALAKPAAKPRGKASDAEIQAALTRGMRASSWTDRAIVNFTVHRGVVELSGVDPVLGSLMTLDPRGTGSRIARDLGDGRYAVDTSGFHLGTATGTFTVYADDQPTPQTFSLTFTNAC